MQMGRVKMNKWTIRTLILATILLLAACGRGEQTPEKEAPEPVSTVSQESSSGNTVQQRTSVLTNEYEGALPPMNQLILGILLLEESDNAITAEQAASMLVLWQALQSGTIQNQTERAAILSQIEGTLTEAQIEDIRAMQLTFSDMNEWARNNGIELPQFGQGRGQGGQGGQGGPLSGMSEDERAAFRQEMQSLSPEERQERLREMGVEIPEGGFRGQGGGGGPGGAGRFGILMAPLIELLESKSAF